MSNQPKIYTVATAQDTAGGASYRMNQKEIDEAMLKNAALDAKDGGKRCELIRERNTSSAGQYAEPLRGGKPHTVRQYKAQPGAHAFTKNKSVKP